MLKQIVLSIITMFSISSFGAISFVDQIVASQQGLFADQAETQGLNWNVGDSCNYNMNMGFVKGTMQMLVREKNAEGYWLDQNMDLGFLGKQAMSALIDPNTGAIKKLIVNGKEQEPPEPGDYEVIEVKEDKVTVPAGTFDAVYMKAKDKKNNQEVEQWANPRDVPIMGMLKSVSPGQFGPVTLELTSFQRK